MCDLGDFVVIQFLEIELLIALRARAVFLQLAAGLVIRLRVRHFLRVVFGAAIRILRFLVLEKGFVSACFFWLNSVLCHDHVLRDQLLRIYLDFLKVLLEVFDVALKPRNLLDDILNLFRRQVDFDVALNQGTR